MSQEILRIENLIKTYRSEWSFKKIHALDINELTVNEGEAYGYLGENGAGKTTTIKCILNFIKKDKGKIYFRGSELKDNKQNNLIGYLPELPYFYDHLTLNETLLFYGSLNGIKGENLVNSLNEVLELLKLIPLRNKFVTSLSKGQKQRLGFAQAIINKPKLLILDEPFSGLDPIGRIEIKQLILKLKNEGTTIFMSSHILNDVEEICDSVCFIKNGRILKSFAINDIPNLFPTKHLLRYATKMKPNDILAMEFETLEEAQLKLVELVKDNYEVIEFKTISPRLEDLFLKINEC